MNHEVWRHKEVLFEAFSLTKLLNNGDGAKF
jgi:hypothetical protein